MKYGVLILNRFPELARNLIASIRATHTFIPKILVVADGHKEDFGPGVVTVSMQTDSFVFSRNANVGLEALKPLDVILLNDDVTILQENCLDILAEHSQVPNYGIVGAMVDGGVGQPYQGYHLYNQLWRLDWKHVELTGMNAGAPVVCFVAVYLKRRMIDEIGLMDERFTAYGFDDNDYCLRARRAHWRTLITSRCWVRHGTGGAALDRGNNWSASYAKTGVTQTNEIIFNLKYHHKPQAVSA
jgi:GT2 family glycosyltransferase